MINSDTLCSCFALSPTLLTHSDDKFALTSECSNRLHTSDFTKRLVSESHRLAFVIWQHRSSINQCHSDKWPFSVSIIQLAIRDISYRPKTISLLSVDLNRTIPINYHPFVTECVSNRIFICLQVNVQLENYGTLAC